MRRQLGEQLRRAHCAGPASLADGLSALSDGFGPEHAVAAALGPNSAVCEGAERDAKAGRSGS